MSKYVLPIPRHRERWEKLLEAAQTQPNPTPDLIAALKGLENKRHIDGETAHHRQFSNTIVGRLISTGRMP